MNNSTTKSKRRLLAHAAKMDRDKLITPQKLIR